MLPAASEPIVWYYDDEIYYDEVPVQAADDAQQQHQAVQPVVPVSAPRVQRAGAVVPVGAAAQQRPGARAQQVTTRQPAGAPAPQGRAVQQRGTQARTAVPTAQAVPRAGAQQGRGNAVQQRGAAPSRAVVTRGPTRGQVAQQQATQARAVQASVVPQGLLQGTDVNQPLHVSDSGTAARAVVSGAPIPAQRAVGARNAGPTAVDPLLAERQAVEELRNRMEIAGDIAGIEQQVTDQCLSIYYNCMDDICANVNDVLGRCACSPNAQQYTEMLATLRNTGNDLQDIVRNIQYLGLTRDEVESLFTRTEAELALEGMNFGADDQSGLRSMILGVWDELPDINDIGTAGSRGGFGRGFGGGFFDLDSLGDFGDFSTMFGGGTRKQFDDIANMSGTDLYRAAKNKCQSVLTECQKKRVDVELMQAKYDVEIGKACVVIRDDLDDSIRNAQNMVRNARMILERARFQVAQEKNILDMKGCVQELDKCMTDDFVCGKNYARCIDGTGQFVSSDGKDVVPGSDLIFMQHYLWGSRFDYQVLSGFAPVTAGGTNRIEPFRVSNDGRHTVNSNAARVVQLLAAKIGHIDNQGHIGAGFCAGVMRQCQRLAYHGTGGSGALYNPNNEVVKNYLLQALPRIRSAQDSFIANFQTQCVSDLRSCYQRQLQNVSGGWWGGGAANVTLANFHTMRSACSSIGLSCAFAVFNDEEWQISPAPASVTVGNIGSISKCERSWPEVVFGGTQPAVESRPTGISVNTCLDSISEVPLQGLVTCGNGAVINLNTSNTTLGVVEGSPRRGNRSVCVCPVDMDTSGNCI